MINTIVGNLQLRISNLHIRYEDDTSYPGHHFAVGVTLKDIIADTVDEWGRKAFVTSNVLKLLRKVSAGVCMAAAVMSLPAGGLLGSRCC